MDAMFLELQIQIRVGEATGTPMLESHDIARLRLELAADLATPRAVFESLMRPGCFLNWRNVLPSLVVARMVSVMQRIENPDVRRSRSLEDLHHMRNTLVGFSYTFQTIPYFAALGNEIVIRIDHQKSSDV